METLKNTYVKPSQIKLTINHDTDVYTQDGKLLLRVRKDKLTTNKIDRIIDFAQTKTSNRATNQRQCKL